MSLVIGMDEAGYGPNLGPLLITASVWEVSGDPRKFDFWSSLSESVSQTATKDGRLYVADSKAVYTPQRGLADLERGVLAVMSLNGRRPQTYREFVSRITGEDDLLDPETWFRDADVPLPLVSDASDVDEAADALRANLDKAGIKFRDLRSDVVLTERFNRVVEQFDNKASAHASFVFGLLSRVWPLAERTLVIGDKLGGRNRYDDLIADIPNIGMVFRQEESSLISRYRVDKSELRFQQKAEQHFPVAVSSMICKYAREVGLELFNRFWQQHVPGLKPTKGYPEDAKRFRDDVDAARQKLGISDREFWRCR
mgnify:CR=1 FL=1